MTKTMGYKVSWTDANGKPQAIQVTTLRAARTLLNNVVLDYGCYDAKLQPVRRTFNEIVIQYSPNGPRKL